MLRFLVPLAAALLIPIGARAAGWQRPDWTMRVEAVSSSDLFQDSLSTGRGQGVGGEARIATSVRSRGALKWSFEATGGGVVYTPLREASRGWVGGSMGVRRAGSQLVIEGEWTPNRVKFLSDPDNAAFERGEWRIGLRQNVAKRLRVRGEGRFTRDDYVRAFDGRDARARGGYAQVALAASGEITLRAHLEIERNDAAADRYDHREQLGGGALSWRGARWQADALVESGVRRYTRALATENNYRRRDQWIGTTTAVGYRLAPGRTLLFTAQTVNQTSSRLDREYDAHTFQLAFEWAAPAP